MKKKQKYRTSTWGSLRSSNHLWEGMLVFRPPQTAPMVLGCSSWVDFERIAGFAPAVGLRRQRVREMCESDSASLLLRA